MGLKLPKVLPLRNSSDALVGHGKLHQRHENVPGQVASQGQQSQQDQPLLVLELFCRQLLHKGTITLSQSGTTIYFHSPNIAAKIVTISAPR